MLKADQGVILVHMTAHPDQGLLSRAALLGEPNGDRESYERYAALIAPYRQAIVQLRAGDLTAADEALRYLETRPRFHRSGYLAESLIKVLGQQNLPSSTQSRLERALEGIIAEQPSTRERGIAQRVLDRLRG